MELPELDELKQLDRKKILLGTTALILVLLAAGAVYAYSQVDVNNKDASFSTNATILDSNESENLTAGLAMGQGMSFGKFSSNFNKTKSLNLSADSLTLAEVEVEGNISDRLDYEERHLFEGRTQIPFELHGNQSGFFEGEINLELKTAQNKWGEKWLNFQYNYF
ncbi:hypothetical protein [Candidatus Nanohalobium constans]|uniref:Uncharacterized protein n=1 Tax=Candidatus Nanohalobium constans TaxID=2565781 RepID=A0A5Q0UFI7_9ARCH|nr:hypothetical protein [Candidatus Nanohalobium constans]QGA80131.1 hypothetical protein LC1Nh_0227 [Candidatus Nanohalobium constans]